MNCVTNLINCPRQNLTINQQVQQRSPHSTREIVNVIVLEKFSIIGEMYSTVNGITLLNFSEYLFVPRNTVTLSLPEEENRASITKVASWYLMKFVNKPTGQIDLSVNCHENNETSIQRIQFTSATKSVKTTSDFPKYVFPLNQFIQKNPGLLPSNLSAALDELNYTEGDKLSVMCWKSLEMLLGHHLLAARIADIYTIHQLGLPDASELFKDHIIDLFKQLRDISLEKMIKEDPNIQFAAVSNNGPTIASMSIESNTALINRLIDSFSFHVRAKSFLTTTNESRQGLEVIINKAPGSERRHLFAHHFSRVKASKALPKIFDETKEATLLLRIILLPEQISHQQLLDVLQQTFPDHELNNLSKKQRELLDKLLEFIDVFKNEQSISKFFALKLVSKLIERYGLPAGQNSERREKSYEILQLISEHYPNFPLRFYERVVELLELYPKMKDSLEGEIIIDQISKLAHISGTFSPKITTTLIKYLRTKPELGKIETMLDGSAGWGSRMIGAAAAGMTTYIGVDPNPDMHEPYRRIISFLREHNFIAQDATYDTIKGGIETKETTQILEKYFGLLDLFFTSSQFFNCETYNIDDPDQSSALYTELEIWLKMFLEGGLIKQAYNVLRIGGIFALHIANYKQGEDLVPLADRFVEIMETKYSDKFKPLGMIGAHRQVDGKQTKRTPIYLYQKIAPRPQKRPIEALVDNREKPRRVSG